MIDLTDCDSLATRRPFRFDKLLTGKSVALAKVPASFVYEIRERKMITKNKKIKSVECFTEIDQWLTNEIFDSAKYWHILSNILSLL